VPHSLFESHQLQKSLLVEREGGRKREGGRERERGREGERERKREREKAREGGRESIIRYSSRIGSSCRHTHTLLQVKRRTTVTSTNF
jgi:hypothetical protein